MKLFCINISSKIVRILNMYNYTRYSIEHVRYILYKFCISLCRAYLCDRKFYAFSFAYVHIFGSFNIINSFTKINLALSCSN